MPWRDKSRSRIDSQSSVSANSGSGHSTGPLFATDRPSNSVFHLPSTPSNTSPSSSPFSSARHANQDDPSMHSYTSKKHWAYKRGAQSTITAENQIESDMIEVRNIIANYAMEPLELLHLVDRWLQQLLGEFLQQRDRFKHRLRESWDKQELTNIKFDNNDRIRKIYAAYKKLEQARDTVLSSDSFNELDNRLARVDSNTANEMKQQFGSLIQKYFDVLQCLELIDKEINGGSIDNNLKDIKQRLIGLKKLNDKPSHTICIVGLEKAGKSTFINALLGFELLPTASERCTQIRTVLKPPHETGAQQLFATVKFYDDQEFQVLFNKMVKRTDESQQPLQHRKDEVMQARERLKIKFPEEHFRIVDPSNAARERKNIIKQLHEYITGEVYINIIKEIAIYTAKLPGKSYELLDVPGFDSPIKEHRDAGLQAVKSADAFLFLTNGQQPSLTEPQVRLLHEIQQNHFEAMGRAFGIITKLDLCQTPATYEEHYEKAYAELVDKHFKPERIYAACPRIQMLDGNSEEFRIIDRKIHSFGDDLVQGFQRSKDGLNKFIEFDLPKTHMKQLIDIGKKALVQHTLGRINKINEKQLLPQNIHKMSIDEYIKQQNAENWDEIYEKNIFQPIFEQANCWHTIIVTKERPAFIQDTRQRFRGCFLDLTKEFVQQKFPIEKLMFEKYGSSKLQLNAHPIDTEIREKLSMKLEKIVDQVSDILAEYLYHKYVCELESLLNNICPQSKDLYRTKLTIETCRSETHALVLRVCRPTITATLRYSYLDLAVKQDALKELICIAPTVAFRIVNSHGQDGDSDLLGSQILASAELLNDEDDHSTPLIKALFRK